MATSKLLKPTNVTISIPEFTDQPDQRVNSNCIDKSADAINSLSEQMTYKTGDTFPTRSWRAVGRITISGKGLYCWIDLAKPVNATSFDLTFSESPNIFGISSCTASGTISNKFISGNELQFTIDLSSTHTAGQIGIAEFNASITLT